MDDAWRRARLDELWDTYITKVEGLEDLAAGQDRAVKAVEMLHMMRILYTEAYSRGDRDQAMLTASRGRVVWQLLSLEFGDWLLDVAGLEHNLMHSDDWTGSERIALKAVLAIHERSGPHAHRPAVDPLPVLMPKWIAHRLADALDALDHGEVQGLLRPQAVGRHDDAWSWDQMRACALEHVANLRGQGLQAQVAQRRVAVAMKVAVETLRSWERTSDLKKRWNIALQAGQLKSLFDDDPDYAKRDGNTVDSEVLARYYAFRADPLGAFGQRYRERFGFRHNQDPGGGD